jgi:hypothetical protein
MALPYAQDFLIFEVDYPLTLTLSPLRKEREQF